jgi:integrase
LKDGGLAPASAANYSKTFRSILRRAVVENIIVKNPAESVPRITAPETNLVFLNIDELRRLAATDIEDRGSEIKRAFLFACYTGLRVSDLETLIWGQIEINPMQIIKRQVKTQEPVYIPLNSIVKSLIGDGAGHKPEDKLFDLEPNKRRRSYHILKRWAEAANVKKDIGWHTARRTFGTLALENGAELYTVAKLLGHTSISQTVKYAKVTDKLRREAIDALPEIQV